MATKGDYLRPLAPDLVLPDSTKIGLLRAVPVGPAGGQVRDALNHVMPGYVAADTDWVTFTWNDTGTFGDPAVGALVDDDFAGTAVSGAWIKAGSPTVSGGRLHLPNTFPQSSITSNATAVLAGRAITIFGLIAPVGSGNDASKARGMLVQSSGDPNNTWIQFMKYSSPGLLMMRSNPGTLTTIPYDPVAHANLRVRVASGQLYWETSPTGGAWTVRRQLAAPAWTSSDPAFLMVYGGATASSGSDWATESSIDRVLWA